MDILSVSLILLSLASVSTAKAPYCLAGDASCFPGIDELAAFNASIGGRLSAPPPYGNVCYNGTFDLAACQELVNNKRKAAFRENITAAMMYVNNEFDENGLGCPVPNTVPSSPLLGTCALGALGAYFVNAQSAEDVSLAMKFAAKYNLRLRIKNTGHDHTGRSTDPGAFIIRTSGMKSLEFEPDFVPYGCKSTCGGPQPVLALGAGVITKDLYSASEKLGVVTIGGFTPTVGMAGGFLVGGGALGPWQPLFGMGVDNVVQYDVVLVDGTITTVNKCHNADLFWAMRGGGGVYAIVIKAYLKAHPAFQAVNVVVSQVVASSPASYQQMINSFVDKDPIYMQNFSSGLWAAQYPGLTFIFQKGFQAGETVVPANTSAAAFDFIKNEPGVNVTVTAMQFPTFNSAYENLILPAVGAGSSVGVSTLTLSRIISKDLLGSSAGRQTISSFITSLPNNQSIIFERVAGGAVSKIAAQATSVHPAWRDALAYVVIPAVDSTSMGPTTAAANATLDRLIAAANPIFGPQAYYNEDNRREADYGQVFWGSNYERLLSLKKRFDPECVLSGSATVGETDFCIED